MRGLIPLLLLPLSLIGCKPGQPDLNTPITRNNIEEAISHPGHGFGRTLPFESELKRAFAVQAAADIVVDYDGRTMAVTRDGPAIRHASAVSSPPSKLIHHFDSRPGKKLVVVIFAKNVWSEARVESEIHKANRYFFARGYHRVVILQASSGVPLTHSDTTRSGGT